jgi:hypothetical protein
MFIIWGTISWRKEVGTGRFYCPTAAGCKPINASV